MKIEIDRGYDWVVICILVCLVMFLLGARFVDPVVQYFSPDSAVNDASPSDAKATFCQGADCYNPPLPPPDNP